MVLHHSDDLADQDDHREGDDRVPDLRVLHLLHLGQVDRKRAARDQRGDADVVQYADS